LPWYAGVTRYQWLVLVIASAGRVFDAFEGQLFNITRVHLLADLLGVRGDSPEIKRWGDILLAVFLVGGTAGGIVFGMLADRFGRQPIMAATILFYSVFSGLTYFATDVWHVAVLRFLVALGVGGEWAVAAALVAEVFPARARAHASGIFHATSVLGIWLAALAALAAFCRSVARSSRTRSVKLDTRLLVSRALTATVPEAISTRSGLVSHWLLLPRFRSSSDTRSLDCATP